MQLPLSRVGVQCVTLQGAARGSHGGFNVRRLVLGQRLELVLQLVLDLLELVHGLSVSSSCEWELAEPFFNPTRHFSFFFGVPPLSSVPPLRCVALLTVAAEGTQLVATAKQRPCDVREEMDEGQYASAWPDDDVELDSWPQSFSQPPPTEPNQKRRVSVRRVARLRAAAVAHSPPGRSRPLPAAHPSRFEREREKVEQSCGSGGIPNHGCCASSHPHSGAPTCRWRRR